MLCDTSNGQESSVLCIASCGRGSTNQTASTVLDRLLHHQPIAQPPAVFQPGSPVTLPDVRRVAGIAIAGARPLLAGPASGAIGRGGHGSSFRTIRSIAAKSAPSRATSAPNAARRLYSRSTAPPALVLVPTRKYPRRALGLRQGGRRASRADRSRFSSANLAANRAAKPGKGRSPHCDDQEGK